MIGQPDGAAATVARPTLLLLSDDRVSPKLNQSLPSLHPFNLGAMPQLALPSAQEFCYNAGYGSPI